MADDEKQTEVTRSGTDWEVVSLSSSDYAAAPNKSEIISDASKVKSNQESSLFESGHFVFPPSEHENLPVDLLNETDRKTRDQEKLSDEKEGEYGQKKEDRREEELETVPQDQSFEKEKSQETSSDVEKHEDGLKLGAEKKRGEEHEDGLEWVKKKGLWLYQHVKEANAVWSAVVAAALVGLVILGQRWQREKPQHQHQLK
jgi:hypothetical protein